MTKIGLALGGGGAKGLAHILIFEVLEELGLRPSFITGTSIGAIAGAMYASGASAAELRTGVEELSSRKEPAIKTKRLDLGWFQFLEPTVEAGSMLKADKFLDSLVDDMGVTTFEKLDIPLKVVAADFWNRQQVVFDKGPLRKAIRASMSLPGIFTPVVDGGRVLVDGGAVNPVPYDLLPDDCDLTIAVDVMGTREPKERLAPGLMDSIFNTYQIMEHSILAEKMKQNPPDILVSPQIQGIKVLEFWKTEDIFKQAAPAIEQFKRDLEAKLEDKDTTQDNPLARFFKLFTKGKADEKAN